jgi:hypothetical protein
MEQKPGWWGASLLASTGMRHNVGWVRHNQNAEFLRGSFTAIMTYGLSLKAVGSALRSIHPTIIYPVEVLWWWWKRSLQPCQNHLWHTFGILWQQALAEGYPRTDFLHFGFAFPA